MSHAFREKFKRCYKCIGVEVVHAWDGSKRVGAFSIARYDGIYLVRWTEPIGARESLRLDPYSAHGCGRRAGRFGAGFCKRQTTGPPERLTRGVESGGGRREAAGRAGEGRWMEGMEGWRGGGGGW